MDGAVQRRTCSRLAVELVGHDAVYEEMVTKFIEHFLYIAAAMNKPGPEGMWDEEDGFYYDVLRLPDGRATRLKVRSMVGLLPLCATTVIEPWQRDRVPRSVEAFQAGLAPDAGTHDLDPPDGHGASGRQRSRHLRSGESGSSAADSFEACSTRTNS